MERKIRLKISSAPSLFLYNSKSVSGGDCFGCCTILQAPPPSLIEVGARRGEKSKHRTLYLLSEPYIFVISCSQQLGSTDDLWDHFACSNVIKTFCTLKSISNWRFIFELSFLLIFFFMVLVHIDTTLLRFVCMDMHLGQWDGCYVWRTKE